jgi:hypothetical protein
MDNDYIPEGHTEESWRSSREITDLIGGIVRQMDIKPVKRCIQDHRDGKTYVYFIGGHDTPIKIGLSNAPLERLAGLQTAHWCKLNILAKVEGSLALEQEYHARFSSHRLSGEWFTRCPGILDEIARLNSPRSNCIGEQHG